MVDVASLKLGKLAPVHDKRNIPAKAFFKDQLLPPVPDSFNLDVPGIVNPMYLNDRLGDCVEASQAHMTRRLEYFEQDTVIPITDSDVRTDYYRKEGYPPVLVSLMQFFHISVPDGGLSILNSLKTWRNKGWDAAGRHYDIYAFGDGNWLDIKEVMAIIYYLNGAQVGVNLPFSAHNQTGEGMVWEVDTTPQGYPGSWSADGGLHCVYLRPFYQDGLLSCVSWGMDQLLTPGFLFKYCDELHPVIDNRDKFLKDSPVNVLALDNILKEITK